jgi:tetratricopeptide (TPR) repeat protein
MNNLATLFRKEGKNAQAEPLFTSVLEARRRLLGEDHPDTLLSMNNLADQYLYEGKYAQAEPLFTKVLDLQLRVLGPEHPRRIASMTDLALVYLNEGKYTQAEPLLREVLKSLDQTTPGDWRRYNTESMLGASLSGQKKFPEAEALLLSGYAGLVERKAAIPFDRQFKVGEAGDRIIQLYRDWDKPGKEAEWRKKLRLIAPVAHGY